MNPGLTAGLLFQNKTKKNRNANELEKGNIPSDSFSGHQSFFYLIILVKKHLRENC